MLAHFQTVTPNRMSIESSHIEECGCIKICQSESSSRGVSKLERAVQGHEGLGSDT